MTFLYNKPLDRSLADWWKSINQPYKLSFLIVMGINILAFGFEMSNLTMHHDDVAHIFIQDTILGHYVGRFGLGWLNYYVQNAYFVPFLQMLEGIIFMTAYALLVAYFWGIRKTMDIVLVASIICVFPYMGQLFQYNTAMATYSLAHFLSVLAVYLSTRATIRHGVISVFVFAASFSIYQGVIANSATIFIFWILCQLLFDKDNHTFQFRDILQKSAATLISVISGSLIYIAAVSFLDLQLDSHQGADQAFTLGDGLNIQYALSKIIHGTRSFFLWPENYFPNYLKKLQLVFLACAGLLCLWIPKRISGKIVVTSVFVLASLSPRLLQLLHPEGNYHNLTLTAYALFIAGAVMIINRAGPIVIRNLSTVLCIVLIGGYLLQCNWISTVNYLNTLAHYTTLTQILTRVRSLPEPNWDGKKIAVIGSYKMPSVYPFKKAMGVASDYIDANHIQALARLMRENVTFIKAGTHTPGVLEYAATNSPWPHPGSVGVVNGMGVVILSSEGSEDDS